jgi:hypothetical protein
MIGKRVQFDEETWEALSAVARDKGVTFQEMADEAFADYLKKHKRPVGLMASLKESVGEKSRTGRAGPKRRKAAEASALPVRFPTGVAAGGNPGYTYSSPLRMKVTSMLTR